VQGFVSGRRERTVHRLVLAWVIALLVASTVLATAAPTVAASGDSLAVISPQLRTALAGSETGRVRAVITAWRRSDLPAIKALGIEGATLRHLPMILARGITIDTLPARPQRLAQRALLRPDGGLHLDHPGPLRVGPSARARKLVGHR
jgi:hypothetical protein